MPLSKQDDFFVPEFCEEQESIATTEFSNHPDHAAADEELKNKDNVFAKVQKKILEEFQPDPNSTREVRAKRKLFR